MEIDRAPFARQTGYGDRLRAVCEGEGICKKLNWPGQSKTRQNVRNQFHDYVGLLFSFWGWCGNAGKANRHNSKQHECHGPGLGYSGFPLRMPAS